jgi:hypothetical protein
MEPDGLSIPPDAVGFFARASQLRDDPIELPSPLPGVVGVG